MAVAPPPPISHNPIRRLGGETLLQHRIGAFPPGPVSYSLSRTMAMVRDPLSVLLPAYREYGPVFTIRVLNIRNVFMLGPEANHFMLVSDAERFRWRDGSLGDLIPLLGDGMLTIDGAYHRRARRIMLPMFHRDRIGATVETMLEETHRAIAPLHAGQELDLERWTRDLALRIAMRALFGLDPDRAGRDVDLASEFERALHFYSVDYLLQVGRGPGTPFGRMIAARRRIDHVLYAEIARRRAERRDGDDILSLLMEARDEDDGTALTDREIRDQVMTLLFAGHDTTTSTVGFLFTELARHPHELARLQDEQDRVLGGSDPTPAQLAAGDLPLLEQAIDETLRMYPPAWIGPRRCVAGFDMAGVHVPTGAPVNYCSWASHMLPDVFAEPEAFVPDRFSAENRARVPKGAYVPFGGGSRTCLGMRFGQMEIRVIASLLLARVRLELLPEWKQVIRMTPTLGPRGGLPVVVRERALPAGLSRSPAVPASA